MEIILPIINKHFLLFFLSLIAWILNKPGISSIPNGYNIESKKLLKVFLINIICVFLYTQQKQEIKYQ